MACSQELCPNKRLVPVRLLSKTRRSRLFKSFKDSSRRQLRVSSMIPMTLATSRPFSSWPMVNATKLPSKPLLPTSVLAGKPLPMPRLVKHDLDGYTPNVRTGFGKGLYELQSCHFKGIVKDRNSFSWLVHRSADVKKTHDVCQSRPIANDDGTVTVDRVVCDRLFSAEHVATAGAPS